MYDLEKRKLTLAAATTPVQIGPNTYDLDDNKLILPHSVPFNVGASRKATTSATLWTEVIYNADYPPKVKGGSSILNRAERFPYNKDTGIPGPASYDPLFVKKAVAMRHDEKIIRKHNGKLFLCRVPLQATGVNVPSIPSKFLDSNGYDIEKKTGQLKKMPPDDNDVTLGPAVYILPEELNINSKKYRGCQWSKYKGLRSGIVTSENPGPADYDTDVHFCLPRCEDILTRERNRKNAYLPRYLEQQVAIQKRNSFPGPCEYTIDKHHPVEPSAAPFCVGADRFTYTCSFFPGPTKYTVCDCYRNRKQFGVCKIPFVSKSERFPISQKSSVPAPNAYNPRNTSENLLEEVVKKSQHIKGGFAATAPRKWTYTGVDLGFPAPCDYDVQDLINPLVCNLTSKFKSCSKRFPSNVDVGTPAPGAYEATAAYKKAYYQRSHKKDGCQVTPKEAFNCSAAKFQKMYDFAGRIIGCPNPGPAAYCPPVLPMDKGYHFPQKPRFVYKIDASPGPGHYEINFKYDDALARARDTHNSRLAKEVAGRLKTKPPPVSFATRMNAQKRLRWFARKHSH